MLLPISKYAYFQVGNLAGLCKVRPKGQIQTFVNKLYWNIAISIHLFTVQVTFATQWQS